MREAVILLVIAGRGLRCGISRHNFRRHHPRKRMIQYAAPETS